MLNNKFGNLDCCACSSKPKNTATCNMSTNKLTLGECELTKKQMKEIGFQFAHDLMDYFDNGGNMKDLSAKSVYSLLADIFKANN